MERHSCRDKDHHPEWRCDTRFALVRCSSMRCRSGGLRCLWPLAHARGIVRQLYGVCYPQRRQASAADALNDGRETRVGARQISRRSSEATTTKSELTPIKAKVCKIVAL